MKQQQHDWRRLCNVIKSRSGYNKFTIFFIWHFIILVASFRENLWKQSDSYRLQVVCFSLAFCCVFSLFSISIASSSSLECIFSFSQPKNPFFLQTGSFTGVDAEDGFDFPDDFCWHVVLFFPEADILNKFTDYFENKWVLCISSDVIVNQNSCF